MSYALQNKMTYSRMKNAAGNFVNPSDDSFQAAAASADWANAKDFYLVMTNAPGEQAWPITATNFILMYKQPKNAAARRTPRTSSPGRTQRRRAGHEARLRAAARRPGQADRGVLAQN
jgi:ABC-type phosphate transport system substrate-binding protein